MNFDKNNHEKEVAVSMPSQVSSRRKFMQLAIAAATVTASAGLGVSAFAAVKKTKFDTPVLSLLEASQVSITLTVTAGATGAPAGFSLQWMKLSDYLANNSVWYLSDDTRLCKASFSGNAFISNYNLEPNQSVNVKVGEFLFDNGASSNCTDCLECGCDYVFRVFAHATSTMTRSDFSKDYIYSTVQCGGVSTGCTYTQGYWKTHGPTPAGNNSYVWPDTVKSGGMILGTVAYNPDDLLRILLQQAASNGLVILAHQLIAAKLNIANGASANPVADTIVAADQLIGSLVIPPIQFAGSLAPSAVSGLVDQLTRYNEGKLGVPHCGS